MLLNHSWLSPLAKPATISEEEEEEDESLNDDLAALNLQGNGGENSYDKEVAEWVIGAIERKKSGKMGEAPKPALHAAPLDTVSPAASPISTPSG